MTDLIERQAAIDGIKKEILERGGQFYKGLLVANHVIVHLPPAQPEPQWIPIRDGKPDATIEVNVSCCDDSGDTPFYYTTSGWLTRGGEYWIVDDEINDFVVAWQYLPKPYKGERK